MTVGRCGGGARSCKCRPGVHRGPQGGGSETPPTSHSHSACSAGAASPPPHTCVGACGLVSAPGLSPWCPQGPAPPAKHWALSCLHRRVWKLFFSCRSCCTSCWASSRLISWPGPPPPRCSCLLPHTASCSGARARRAHSGSGTHLSLAAHN